MQIDYDVIIIGAGPAGASCAKHLAENGIKTLIIEKRKLPRIKCCCGLLSNRSVNFINTYFGDIPEGIICKENKLKLKYSFFINKFIKLSNQNWLSVDRMEFDNWLISKSKSEIIENSIYINNYYEDDKIIVEIKDSNKYIKKISCNILIGADGGNSFVRKSIDSSYNAKFTTIYEQKYYSCDVNFDTNYMHYIINRNLSNICSYFLSKNDLIYVGTSYSFENKNNNYHQKTLDYIINKSYISNLSSPIATEVCLVDMRFGKERYCFGKERILLIGEAAGLISIVGEGISSALISGKYAAESIIESGMNNNNVLNLYLSKVINEKNEISNIVKQLF